MSMDAFDAAQEAAYAELVEQISEELYPSHKTRAIAELSADRLKSYYIGDSMLMRPAVDSF